MIDRHKYSISSSHFSTLQWPDDQARKTMNAFDVYSKSTRAKMVTFYKNGDALFSGMKVSLTFQSMGALNDFLTARANIPNGARYIFTLDGRRVIRLEQFEHDGAYVVSGNRNFESLPYGQQKINDWQRNGIKVKVSGKDILYISIVVVLVLATFVLITIGPQ